MIRDRLPAAECAAIIGDARALAASAYPHRSPYGNPLAEPCDPVGLAQAQERSRIRIRAAVEDASLTISTAARIAAAHAALIERVALLGEDAPPVHDLLTAHRVLIRRAQGGWWVACRARLRPSLPIGDPS